MVKQKQQISQKKLHQRQHYVRLDTVTHFQNKK